MPWRIPKSVYGMHIGNQIKEIMAQKGVSATELARRIHCDRTHIYKIQAKEAIDTFLLTRISLALNHDFFSDLSNSLSDSLSRDS